MDSKFLLICGVTGVGKSTIIGHLRKLDSRFVRIHPYTTRKPRNRKDDKIHVSEAAMNRMDSEGKFIFTNRIYGNIVATPNRPIVDALEGKMFPVLDFPIDK